MNVDAAGHAPFPTSFCSRGLHFSLVLATVDLGGAGMTMNYEKLDVYRCAIEFLTISMALIDRLSRGDSALKDQLRRAALSIPLNIAESSGKVFPNDRARFLAIARGSAMECGACLDCLRVLNPGCSDQVERGKQLAQRIVEMLSKMCRPTD